MQRTVRRVATPLFSLLFAASLTFGVASVFAQAEQRVCQTDPPTFLGRCSSELECDQMCWAADGYEGECTNGCCICAY